MISVNNNRECHMTSVRKRHDSRLLEITKDFNPLNEKSFRILSSVLQNYTQHLEESFKVKMQKVRQSFKAG